MFSYNFIIRALIVGILVSLCAALLGVILVLKRYASIGHGLADVGFASISLALAMKIPPFYVSMPIVIMCSFFIMYISQNQKIHGDIAIGVFSTGALALGVIITSFSRGFNADVYSYMFGSILAVSKFDVFLGITLSAVVLGLFIFFYNRLFLVTIDENFAKASGINTVFYQFLISFLTSLTIVLGIRIMGTLLISSLIIFPAIIAKKLVNSFKFLTILSAVISIFCFVAGLICSFLFNIPAGASIVSVNLVLLLLINIINIKKS